MLYLDTSLLVAALTPEVRSERVEAWLQSQAHSDLVVSDWVIAEFSAALSIKRRRDDIDEAQRAKALAGFSLLCAESFTTLPVSRDHFHDAARFADQYSLGLRAADALHLAVCVGHGATLCTLDRRLSNAGPELGVATLLV